MRPGLRLPLAGLIAALLCPVVRAQTGSPQRDIVTVQVGAAPLKTFVPAHAFGGGIDGADSGSTRTVFQPANRAAMRSMGLHSLTYRLRTELGMETWHWNPRGVWSDTARRSGYWISDDRPESGPISLSYGYRLTHRGSTIDQANNDSYSRLDDGDPRTYWKSNPYLDRHFTHESNALHPQWVVADLGSARPVNTIRLDWGAPYAVRYRVEYAVFPSDVPVIDSESAFEPLIDWRPFSGGNVVSGKGGSVTLGLERRPVTARFFRVWMTQSSGEDAAPTAGDIRDRIGYALREISLGVRRSDGSFQDWIRKGRTRATQTVIYVSSTDPYHTAADRDPHVEQPGFDRVAESGLLFDQPMLTPVGILYDTPENAVAELKYLRARHISVTRLELGEEPDGQYITPEDYGALYIQWAVALHRVDPQIALGGPSFQTAVLGWVHWRNAAGDISWLHRFLQYLTAHGHRSDFAFFSFEWYPFDDLTRPAGPQLARHLNVMDSSLRGLIKAGLPTDIPWIISEYGYSPYATQDEVTLPGALINAEIVAHFLAVGGDQAYLYGYEPGDLMIESARRGATYGNLIALLNPGDDAEANTPPQKLPAYWSAWLMSHVWAADPALPHQLFGATVRKVLNDLEDPALAAYPLRLPDGAWSLLLLNKDPARARSVQVRFAGAGDAAPSGADQLHGKLELWRFSAAQYVWKAAGAQGHPIRSLPPELTHPAGAESIVLPPFSISVLRGAR